MTGWWRARSVLPLWLPVRDMTKIGACAACLTAALLLASGLPEDAGGFGLRLFLGGGCYTGCALLLDLAHLRTLLRTRLQRAHVAVQ